MRTLSDDKVIIFKKDQSHCCVENRLQGYMDGNREISQEATALINVNNDGVFDMVVVVDWGEKIEFLVSIDIYTIYYIYNVVGRINRYC